MSELAMSPEHRPGRQSKLRDRIRRLLDRSTSGHLDAAVDRTDKVKPLTLKEYLGAFLPEDFDAPPDRKEAQQGSDPNDPLTLREYIGAVLPTRKKRP